MPLPQKKLIPGFLLAMVIAALAAPPLWWSAGDPPLIDPAAAVNNKGPANIGQAKHMVVSALNALRPVLPTVTTQIETDLVPILDLSIPDPKTPEWLEKQKAPLLIGQLKAIADPFYTRLHAAAPTWLETERTENGANYPNSIFPWTAETTDDANKAVANIGQLKAVFSLRFETLPPPIPVDSDGDGLPDAWELANFGNLNQTGTDDFDNDGLTNAQELSLNTNPASADTDNDGMPDGWEASHGLNPLDSAGINGAFGDLDGDGYNNLREYYFETNPNDSNDRPVGMISAGTTHSAALTADGRVWSWGSNGSGELGDGTTTSRNSPVPLVVASGMAPILSIDSRLSFTLALDENGSLWAWGSNANRKISKDATARYTTPVRILLPSPVSRFACGNNHVLAVCRDGSLWAWGANGNGQLGQGHTNPVSGVAEITKPAGMGPVVSVGASEVSSYAVDAAGKVWAWGHNGNGRLGDGTSTSRNAPVTVDASTGISQIKAILPGDSHVIAEGKDGTIWTWGYNGYGQLATGNSTGVNKPFEVSAGLTLASSLGAGGNHSLAVSPSGLVWAWGRNSNGQLGNNSTTSSNVPVQTATVASWSEIVQVSGGSAHSLALKSDGSIWSWGINGSGRLGLGHTTQRNVPTLLTSLKLTNDDTDEDGLPDSWERFYFNGNLAQSGGDIAVANGVTNLVAYTRGLNPLLVDNDNDGISDKIEIESGLDPLDWSDASGDLDGDRIPNLWELSMLDAAAMTNENVYPLTATIHVDAARNTADTPTAKKTITAAINQALGNTANPPYTIIKVAAGIYTENVSLPSNKRILLIPANPGDIPEIRGSTTSATVSIYGESVIDGFRITHAKGVAGTGVYAYPNGVRPIARIVNCMIHGHTGSEGRGIYQYSGRLVIAHCSVFANTASNYGNGLHVRSSSSAILMNSIFWNAAGQAPEEIYYPGEIVALQSIIRDGSIAGALMDDPALSPLGFLTQGSPAIGSGFSKAMAFRDVHNEARGSQPDIGADQFIDTDGDGLPDWLEALGVVSATADNDNDGLSNLAEYESTGTDPNNADTDGDGLNDGGEFAAGTNPFDPDTDTDGMPDGWEVQHGLNPLDDRDAIEDADGDRIPNLWEYKRGTIPANDPNDPNSTLGFDSRPNPDWIVDPALAGTSNHVATINQAIINSPTNVAHPAFYSVIEVRHGVYGENVSIPWNKKITLLGQLGYPLTEIRSTADNSPTIDIRGESFVDGFRVSRTKDLDETPFNGKEGVYVSTSSSSGKRQVSLSNLVIHGHRSTNGAGIYCASGHLRVLHCTIYDTGAQYSGNAIYFNSVESLEIQNCIIRGDKGTASQQIYKNFSATVNVSGSFILGGEYGSNATDPMLTPVGFLHKNSPAINSGLPSQVKRDIHNELRSGNPDPGADEFVDTDTDGLPDWLEALGVVSATADNDNDGLSNLAEYETTGTDPLANDTDGDGLNDGDEVAAGTNPFDPDTDTDGIPDGWEVQYGLDPLNDGDALEDPDGDRIPNLYEFHNGTVPSGPSGKTSFPSPHITVDPTLTTQTAVLKNTISAAISEPANANRYTVIRVKPGTYANPLTINSRHILLLGDLGAELPVIQPSSGFAVRINENSAVLDGFSIRGNSDSIGQGLYVHTALNRDQARIVNCIITEFKSYYGSAASVVKGTLTVAHCTVMDNSATTRGRAFELYTGRLVLQNSIVWNPEGAAPEQIYQPTPGAATATNSIILGGELGAISLAPMTDRYHCLMPGSPALGAGAPLPVSLLDRHGEPRPSVTPDTGADQYLDSDNDTLPDWWEMNHFGDLLQSATDDNDTPELDRLTNKYEYLLGFDPTVPDTWGNGKGDFYNAVFGSTDDPWYPSEWLLDPDIDGLTNGQESYYGTDPLNPDTNGDGIIDSVAILLGIDPIDLDPDGDTLTNAQEAALGTNPLLWDTDGDGVSDHLDAFPLDPTRWELPTTDPGDNTAPVITLLEPLGTTPIP